MNDRNAVEHLEGAKVYCKESELLPLEEEEFWVTDLVGMDVVTTGGAEVGKVISVIAAGNDLLEIEPVGGAGGKTILVPFVKDMVPVVDSKNKRIEVVDVPGLLEPQ
jgi:16S rRNA processing protein RimM